jgi:hypothetical protein
MDPLAIALFALMWICTTVLAFGTGWVRGYDTSNEKHRWSRWLLKRQQNRSVRF